jgi:HsdM N-terminal domain/N-6 DNA Methylase
MKKYDLVSASVEMLACPVLNQNGYSNAPTRCENKVCAADKEIAQLARAGLAVCATIASWSLKEVISNKKWDGAVVAVKKSEIYSSLWQSCDALRGGMDASQYKDYVLVLLFMKYVSDKYAGRKDALIEVPKGGSFTDMVALKGDKEIGDKINKIISRLAGANDLKGVIDVADFNDADKLGSGKEMVDRLSDLVTIFNRPELDFRKNRAEGDDILGDAYEYLMRHFATESGKSKGQFYTPAEVSRIVSAYSNGIRRGLRAIMRASDLETYPLSSQLAY